MSPFVVFLIGFLTGAALAVFVTAFIFAHRSRKAAIGTLQIVEMIGEEPYLFLSLDTDVASFTSNPTVTMNVTHRWASHK